MKLLGVNIDHIATLRNARGVGYPSLMRAVENLEKCKGVEYITIHLREDRRHINDLDAKILCENSSIKINLEIACTEEMIEFALKHKPYAVCLVPEKREEMTTESGLDLTQNTQKFQNAIKMLQDEGVKATLFLDPLATQTKIAKEIGANAVEIHTGSFANAKGVLQNTELQRIIDNAKLIESLKMQCHAGHGITYENALMLVKIPEIKVFNIGHFLVCEAVFLGLEGAINEMVKVLNS